MQSGIEKSSVESECTVLSSIHQSIAGLILIWVCVGAILDGIGLPWIGLPQDSSTGLVKFFLREIAIGVHFSE